MNMALPTRVLGKTGIPLPILGFGTAPAGTRLTHREAVHLFEAALNAGVKYFDTAPEFAGYGKAQEQLGHLLKRRRQEIFLVTKCFDPTYDGTLKLLERNLKELQTDHADLVFVHSLGADKMDPAVVFSRQGAYSALVKAKALGLTKFIGFSGHNRPGRFAEAIQRYEVDVLLNVVNFADRHTYNFEEQVWLAANRLNLGLIAMKVFGGQKKSEAMGLSHCKMPSPYLDQAFRYALSVPQVACAVIGMATSSELQDNLRRARSFSSLNAREGKNLMKVGQALASQWGTHWGALV
jgi:predicted aldo/keto reductase-like oxidoreductase